MSRSTVYKETDRETKVWEDDQAPRKTYTTVRRYQVPETSRSTVGDDDNNTKEKIVIRTTRSSRPLREDDDVDIRFTERTSDRDRARGSKEEDDYRFSEQYSDRQRTRGGREEEDVRFSERETVRDREPRQNVTYRVVERESDYDDRRSTRGDDRSYYRSDFRERDRDTVQVASPQTRDRDTVFRFERDRDFSPQQYRRDRDDEYQVERYSKETDYYQPQPIIIREAAPQPIIIREERRDPPIIIRERRREPQYEFIERQEVVEQDKQLVKKEEPPPASSSSSSPSPPTQVTKATTKVTTQKQEQQQDDDYYYERRVREIDRAPRKQQRERTPEIHPKDSASQVSSEDSYEYVRRERTYDEDRDKDPHHKRHLLEGALAGAAGAEIIRRHRKSTGGDPGSRWKSGAAGAAVGAIGAEVVSRVRSRSRRRQSRSRSRSDSRDSYDSRRTGKTGRRSRRDDSRSRSRSRSKSKSRTKQLAGLAGVAAIGALAGYALKNRGNKETVIVNDPPRRRSGSRRRRGSADSYMEEGMRGEDDKHRDPSHRNRVIAQAGLASAAAGALWEHHRSKSRSGKGRSKSRLRQSIPIAAAGLGGAALAGLYEKNKANKEAKRDAIIQDEMGRGRRPQSRSRSRSIPGRHGDARGSVDNGGMIAYGNEPVYPDGQRGYYSDEEPAQYRRRHPGGSSAGSSPDNRRRRSSRSRSRGRGYAEAGAAAGVAAVAAHELGKRHARDQQRYEGDRYQDQYGQGPGPYDEPPSGYLPPQQNAGYPSQQQYPGANYFPPPPTGENAYVQDEAYPPQQQYHQYEQQQQENPYPAYNPADYAQSGAPQNPYDPNRDGYGSREADLGAPYGNEAHVGENREVHEEPPREEGRRGRSPENVSAPNNGSAINNDERETQDAGGVTPPSARARSTSRVRFNLDANESHSPEKARTRDERYSDTETSGDQKRRHRRRRHHDHRESRDSPSLMHDRYERTPSHTNDDDSDGTVEMPERFDDSGNRKGGSGDPLEALLGNLASKFLGGGDDDHSSHDSRSGRRRH